MKYILLLFTTGVFSLVTYSQHNEIAEWQKKHPHVLFVEQSDYTSAFREQLESLNRDVIVYNDEITMDIINTYTSQKQEKSTIHSADRIEEANAIKIWLNQHQDLKIVPRSVFNTRSESEQEELIESSAMVLQAEKVTLQDIENYEATH